MSYYLFAGYAVIWILLFAYILSISSKQRKLEMELETLRKLLDRKK
ncbi:MAG: CcmD family protein [Vicinamibacteria bacterium]